MSICISVAIYAYALYQLWRVKPVRKGAVPHGRHYYKLHGICNILFAFIGLLGVEVVSRFTTWISCESVGYLLIKIAFIVIYSIGSFYVVRALISAEP